MYERSTAARYVSALVSEIRNWNQSPPESGTLNAGVDTIYLGGGTPSLLSCRQIEDILNAVRERFPVSADAEVTIEMNPGDGESVTVEARSDTPARLLEWQDLGINRVSFGAQTFDDEGLKQLGRTHTAADIRRTFQSLRAAGFKNINFDLIAGLSGQTMARWQKNLEEALTLRPEHLSLYLLDVHEGTPLADQIRRGMRAPVDEDLTAEMYRVMIETVCAAGYEHYEISNFCLPGKEARHNTKYWLGAPYYGFGCSAHSYDGGFKRWSNERDAAGYAGLIEAGRSPVVETVELSEQDARAESMFLGLRMMRGLSVRDLKGRFGVDPFAPYESDLARFGAAGLLEIDGDLIRLTRHGALLSNEVFATFV